MEGLFKESIIKCILIPSALHRFDMQMNRVESRAAIYLPRRDPKQHDSGASAKGQPNNSTHYNFQSDDDEFSMFFGPMCALHLR